MKRFAAVAGLGFGLGMLAQVASAAPVQLTSFDNFTLDAIYGSWGAPFAVLTPGAEGWTVRSHNYGSGYKYLGAEFDAGDNDTVQLKVTVSEGVAGCLIDLVDANNNGVAFRFYGLTPGNGTNGTNEYTMTMKLSDGQYFTGTGVLDKTRISQMNVEIDPGPTNDFYTATFNDLSLINSNIPEPASLAGAAIGCALLARRSRR